MFEKTANRLLFNENNYRVAIYVGLMASKMHPRNSVFDTGARQSLIREHLLKTEWLGPVEASARPSLKSATSKTLSIVGTIASHVRMRDSKLRLFFGGVRIFSLITILATSFIDRVVKGTFLTKRKIDQCISKPVSILAIEHLSERTNTRITRHETWWLQKKNIPHAKYAWWVKSRYCQRPECLVVATTDATELRQIVGFVVLDSSRAWTVASGFIEAFRDQVFNATFIYRTIHPTFSCRVSGNCHRDTLFFSQQTQ